jgi:putative aldouronate transport system permease protein
MKKITHNAKGDMMFDVFNFIVLSLVMLSVLYPLYFIIIASFSDPAQIYAGKVLLIPKEITFEGYQRVFSDQYIWSGYINSIFYTILGTLINLILTLTAGFCLSRKKFFGGRFIMLLLIITMYFDGGLIPNYLLMQDLKILNTVWAMVIPNAVSVFNILIARTFFVSSVPEAMIEAARIDGCDDFRLFFRIILPTSQALIAVLTIFYAVGHWNSYFNALIFLRDQKLYPLQMVLRKILVQNEASASMLDDVYSYVEKQRITEIIKYAVIMVASVPMMILYPFLQKYFVKGVMIGAVKG